MPSDQTDKVIRRHQFIQSFNPDFIAIGDCEFLGYIVYGFEPKNIYLMECCLADNATYIFGEKWKELSKLSKTQILAKTLQKDRIIHSANWQNSVMKHFEQKKGKASNHF